MWERICRRTYAYRLTQIKECKIIRSKTKMVLCRIVGWRNKNFILGILPNKKEITVSEFMIRTNRRFNENWIKIKSLLSDNGKEFTTHHKSWVYKHIFEKTLVKLGMEHKYTRVRRSEINGKIERYWRILNWWFESKVFVSINDLILKYNNWFYFYNNIRWHG